MTTSQVTESQTRFVPFILGLGGTARAHSSSEHAAAEALRSAKLLGARTQLFDGAFLTNLSLYNPDRQERTPSEAQFIAAIRECHGLIVASPGYHGSLSGPIKNALDLIEDTAHDAHPYLDGKSFGCIITAFGWQGSVTTLVALRSVAHALRAWPTPFGAALNSSTPLFEADGSCIDRKVAGQLAVVAAQVVEFAWCRVAGLSSLATSTLHLSD